MTGDISAMADRLGLSVRRCRQLVDAGVLMRDFNDEFDIELNASRYRSYSEKDTEGVCREIAQLTQDIDAGMRQLRSASPARRAKLVPKVGPMIGRLDVVFCLSNAMVSPGERDLLTNHTNFIIGRVIADFLSLAGLELIEGSV